MDNSVSWLFDCFLLFFHLHVNFKHPSIFRMLSCHLSFSSSFFSCFILLYSSLCFLCLILPTAHCPSQCNSTMHFLIFILLLYALLLYLVFSPKLYSKNSCPTGPQHLVVACPESLRPITCSSMPQLFFGRFPFLPPLLLLSFPLFV
jgi:hypothetical protein